jgi:hypothetical protein
MRKNKVLRSALSTEAKKAIRAGIVLRREKNTRAQCEAAIKGGADPKQYLAHPNSHVKKLAEKAIARANAKAEEKLQEIASA